MIPSTSALMQIKQMLDFCAADPFRHACGENVKSCVEKVRFRPMIVVNLQCLSRSIPKLRQFR
ncbi:hypothetical protein THICB1_150095 [Thiomonas arsenitoxydans]|uniref:Uncharacterized protein n=1 Tax=Thiomonas arsenitoxydans (strain DSM 22701 / CIP 110005 / 3As) TaxID=426114 RepID=A0ABM9T3S3_THIA3|nr:hypothetical protein ACO7_130045 [Thiomonas arsenitoxydans]CQR29152.1 hypothetical protein ACO3_150026 [Thiomonas arsenitoxydans]CQR30685.1 hypothetical protein THICB1_150095 [Thiomonas arsenitoxydans]CQR35490.1 hypothetical protein THICB6_230018 [Thiomonas arsenitoxydans]